jgi:CBS domain-containing protein
MDLQSFMQSPAYGCKPEATLEEAARDMETHEVGSLVVNDESDRIVGIVTDRDLALALAHGQGSDTQVHEVMSRDVTLTPVDADLESVARAMNDGRVRHLPVVNEHNRLVGMVSIDDLYRYLFRATSALVRVLGDRGPAST